MNSALKIPEMVRFHVFTATSIKMTCLLGYCAVYGTAMMKEAESELLPDNTVQYPRRQSPYAWNYFLLTVRGIAYILTEKYKNIFSYLKYSSVVNGYVLVSKLSHSLSIVMEIRAWWVGRNATVFWLSEGIVPASWQNATKFLREKLSRISGTIEQTFHKTVSDLCDKLFSPYKFERR